MDTIKGSPPLLKCSTNLKLKSLILKRISFIPHNPPARVQCEVCSKFFNNPASLSAHVNKLHNYREMQSCQFCHLKFLNAKYLRKHTKNIHSTIKRPLLPCTFAGCRTTFLTKDGAMTHFRREHVENPVRFPCNFCPKLFKRKDHLESHIATHTTEKSHQCATCGRSFAQLANLKRHQLTHQAQPARVRVTCHLCPQTFLSKSGLHYHVNISHEGRKEHPCTFCDKMFGLSTTLKCHIEAKHNFSGILHSCDKCGYQSCSRRNLAQHVKSTHNMERYECYFCAKIFPNFTQLVRHMGRIHNLEK